MSNESSVTSVGRRDVLGLPAISEGGVRQHAREIVNFVAFSERLKTELRHSWLSDGRQESVAEHTWQMALLALLSVPHLECQVDLLKALKMILVHDLVEAEAGDVPFFEESERQRGKYDAESAAIEKIRSQLPGETGQEFYDLWHEFENLETLEARFVKALDNLEVQLQHNIADIKTWEEIEYGLCYTKMDPHCAHDEFLSMLCECIREDSELKMRAAGIDVEKIKADVGKK